MLPEINTQLTNKVWPAEAQSFHSPGGRDPTTADQEGQAGKLAKFLTFLLTFNHANIL